MGTCNKRNMQIREMQNVCCAKLTEHTMALNRNSNYIKCGIKSRAIHVDANEAIVKHSVEWRGNYNIY